MEYTKKTYNNLQKLVDKYCYTVDFETKKKIIVNLENDENHQETLELLDNIAERLRENILLQGGLAVRFQNTLNKIQNYDNT